MLGKKVRLAHIFDMAPMVLHKMVGSAGEVKERDKYKPSVWLVVFEETEKHVWIDQKYLKEIE